LDGGGACPMSVIVEGGAWPIAMIIEGGGEVDFFLSAMLFIFASWRLIACGSA